jgi:putative NADPH-quinone reductase
MRRAAREAGHRIEVIRVAELAFPILRTKESFEGETVPADIGRGQDMIRTADHLLILYPLWLGAMPALLKAFFEQVFRPGFAFAKAAPGRLWKKQLTGKSARIVVTMGMPAFVHRWYFGAHSLKSLERNILGLAGIGPIRESLFGMIEGVSDAPRQRWLESMRAGEAGAPILRVSALIIGTKWASTASCPLAARRRAAAAGGDKSRGRGPIRRRCPSPTSRRCRRRADGAGHARGAAAARRSHRR